ncbi:MAG TPA: alpha/beta hydrolase [Acidimicrobiales bacterium]|nr:alpha/beta hydrolase [Acidimicrobiales bacterium]
MLRAFADGRLFGETTGTATPWVLALHGWGRSRSDFDTVLEGLDALAVDLPGFGASPEPPEPWGGAEYAAAVAPLLDDLASPVVILGHSFGGQVAVHLAARHPDRVGALVLTGTPLVRRPKGKASTGFRLARRLYGWGVLSDDYMEKLRQKHGSADYRAARGTMRDVFVRVVNESYDDDLAALACPVELVWGADDAAAPLAQAEEAAGRIADARLTVLPGVGHFTPQAAPDALREAVLRHRPAS